MSLTVRILYICHDGDLYGSQQSLLLILRHLSPNGFLPFVSLARSGPLTDKLKEIPSVTLLSHRRLQWVKHDPRNILQRVADIASLCFGLIPRTLQLYRYIRQYDIQLVHTNSLVSLEGALAARMASVPHVWHIRELFMEENPKLQMVLGRKLTRWVIHTLSDQVLCISKAVQSQFLPYLSHSQKYPVIYNALALCNPPEGETHKPLGEYQKNRALQIGYIGRLSEGKRFHDLLDALNFLRVKGFTQFKLQVAGNFVDNAFEKRVQQTIQHYQLADYIEFLGYQENLDSLYQSLDVLVVPSLNEPFGRVVIESMWQGVPCIAAHSGGIPEIMAHGETGLLYPPKDSEALALLLEQVLQDPASLIPFRENARRMVAERFSIENQMKLIETCYAQVLKESL